MGMSSPAPHELHHIETLENDPPAPACGLQCRAGGGRVALSRQRTFQQRKYTSSPPRCMKVSGNQPATSVSTFCTASYVSLRVTSSGPHRPGRCSMAFVGTGLC
jgi:hypothetical protein